MNLISLLPSVIPSIITLLQNQHADSKQLAAAQECATRLMLIELKINASIIEQVIPRTVTNQRLNSSHIPKTSQKLTDGVAMETVKHLSTEIARALLGGLGIPARVVINLDADAQKLINNDRIPGQLKGSKKGTPVSLIDLLDYLVRKDLEMKALCAIVPIADKTIRSIEWAVRLANFQKVSIAAIVALS